MNLNPGITEDNTDYEAAQIQILEGLEAVRKRPSIYIDSTMSQGLHHMVYEIVDNVVDKASTGHYTRIEVSLNEDGSVTARDNGRDIPAGVQKKTGLSAIQVAFTTLYAGGKFDNSSYKASGSLHGVGVSAVNALSCRLEVQMDQDGYSYVQSYARGVPLDQVYILCPCAGQEHGITAAFQPDGEIFLDCGFDFRTLTPHLQETVFSTNGLEIILYDRTCADDAGPNVCYFCYQNGLRDFISFTNDGQPTLYSDILYGQWGTEGIQAEFVLTCNISYGEKFLSFANNISTPGGGTHISGLRQVLTRAINEYTRKQGLLKEYDSSLSRDELPEGMVTIISVCLKDPRFEGQAKQKLGSSPARPVVDRLVYKKVTLSLGQNPQATKAILSKAVLAKKARAAVRSARDLTRREITLAGLALPSKLTDYSSRDPRECELFIVEGDPVGGSAKVARCREDQAVLPPRSKILNVEKISLDKVCANAEIKAMISVLGAGIMDSFSLEGLRYHKTILMTDADVDGAYIATLPLIFLFRYILKPIEVGHVYLAQPPLYRVEKGRKFWYTYGDTESAWILDDIGRDGTNKIQRYKGLGEMDVSQLREIVMGPMHRTLLRISPEGGAGASDPVSETGRMFSILMSDGVEPRKSYTLEHT